MFLVNWSATKKLNRIGCSQVLQESERKVIYPCALFKYHCLLNKFLITLAGYTALIYCNYNTSKFKRNIYVESCNNSLCLH